MNPEIEQLAREYAEKYIVPSYAMTEDEFHFQLSEAVKYGYTAALSQPKQDEAVEKFKEALEKIAHGAKPASDYEAWIWYNIAYDIAEEALNQLK